MNFKLALILTPAIFMLAIWVLALSTSTLITSLGLTYLVFLAAVLAYGVSLSITIFIKEVFIVS
jgi:hypothetical protein